MFNGRIRVPARGDLGRRSDAILVHELVHALFAQMTGYRILPPWFDEGIAQFVSECGGDSCYPFKMPVNKGGFLRVELFEQPFTKLDRLLMARAYRQSLYTVMTIVNLRGLDVSAVVIDAIAIDSKLGSDALLKPLELSYKALYKHAEAAWQKNHRFLQSPF